MECKRCRGVEDDVRLRSELRGRLAERGELVDDDIGRKVPIEVEEGG